MKRLIIVESPTKAKIIKKIIDDKCVSDDDITIIVKASIGHVKDLPKEKIGFSIKNNKINISYIFLSGKKKLLDSLKKLNYDELILATDDDLEGELIAWHIQSYLKPTNCTRVVFKEITEHGIMKGFSEPRSINNSRICAQQARRIIDRMIGYIGSNIIHHPIGRVQLAAMSIIENNESGRKNQRDVVSVDGYFELLNGKVIRGRLTSETDFDQKRKWDCNANATTIVSKDLVSRKEYPPKPYNTSSILKDTITKYGYQAHEVMKTLQTLFENGFITYHRTDSTSISDSYKLSNNVTHILTKDQDQANQHAHECIRPTKAVNMDTIDDVLVKSKFGKNVLNVYNLIWKRTAAALEPIAIIDEFCIKIKHGDEEFICTSQNDLDCDVGDMLRCEKIICKVDKGGYKQIFDEAKIIRELEKVKVGRPSTYASILPKLIDKKYVVMSSIKEERESIIYTYEQNKNPQVKRLTQCLKEGITISLSPLGKTVLSKVINELPQIANLDLTKTMEEKLDNIENGTLQRDVLLKEFYESCFAAFSSTGVT